MARFTVEELKTGIRDMSLGLSEREIEMYSTMLIITIIIKQQVMSSGGLPDDDQILDAIEPFLLGPNCETKLLLIQAIGLAVETKQVLSRHDYNYGLKQKILKFYADHVVHS